MSDVNTNVTDLRLHYQGGQTGFVRIEKSRYISIRREKEETEGDYAQRLLEALDNEHDWIRHRAGYEPKSLKPQDENFLDGFLLEQKKRLAMQASRAFDDACWDGDLKSLCKSLTDIARFFKAIGAKEHDRQVLMVLRDIMAVENFRFYKDNSLETSNLSFEIPKDRQDFAAYCRAVVGAMQLYAQNAPKGMDKV